MPVNYVAEGKASESYTITLVDDGSTGGWRCFGFTDEEGLGFI